MAIEVVRHVVDEILVVCGDWLGFEHARRLSTLHRARAHSLEPRLTPFHRDWEVGGARRLTLYA